MLDLILEDQEYVKLHEYLIPVLSFTHMEKIVKKHTVIKNTAQEWLFSYNNLAVMRVGILLYNRFLDELIKKVDSSDEIEIFFPEEEEKT